MPTPVIYPTKALLDTFLNELKKEKLFPFQQKGYVAPTVYLQKGKMYGSGINYYNSLSDAFEKLKYLYSLGGRDVRPGGSVPLKKDGTAQTIGINCDFYFAANPTIMVNLGYRALKYSIENNTGVISVFRFYKTDGTGPYYAIMDPNYFGGSATKVDSYSADKIAALDRFHREVALLKIKHNTLAIYLNELAGKKLSPVQQQIFNEGSLHLQTMRAEIQQIKGIDFYLSKDGKIGVVFVIPLIAWIIVGALAGGWIASKIVEAVQKTARLNASYNIQKWIADQRLKIAQEEKKGNITPAAASDLRKELDVISENAAENAKDILKPSKSMFGEIGDIVKWAAIGFGIYAISNAVTTTGNNRKSK